MGVDLLYLAAAISVAAVQAPSPPTVEFVTLGTGGGPLTRLKRSQPANAIVVGEDVYLLDVGDGVQRQMRAAGLDIGKVKAVFISHHHIDHNADLAPLLVTRWLLNHHAPVPVLGPPGTKAMVEALADAYRPTELAPISIGGSPKPTIAASMAPRDLAPDLGVSTLVFEDGQVRVFAIANAHYNYSPGSAEARHSRSYSFRIEAGGRTIVFTGDTGPSDRLARFAEGADLLVSEVIDLAATEAALRKAVPPAVLQPMLAHMEHDHLTPLEVGTLASAAGVDQLVLTHLAPGLDQEVDTGGYLEGISSVYRGRVTVADDLDRF